MCADEYMAKLLVLAAVFVIAIILLGVCFLLKLGKIDKVEEKAEFTERRRSKNFPAILLATFSGYCEVCNIKSADYIGDSRRKGDGFISVCEDCSSSFGNLQPIIAPATTSELV